ncbi:MAG: winged helix-turn-helix domain-containing protein [Nanobdellota archaeon]
MNNKKRYLSQKEAKIAGELIKNPRTSDNNISKKTGIPVMTVNRKRKNLEDEGLISYYVSVKKHSDGLKIFNVRQLYIIKLKAGVTRKEYIDAIELNPNLKIFNSTFVSSTFLGEKDGHLALIIMLDALNDNKIVDEFNGKIISSLREKFGDDAIEEIVTSRVNDTIRLHHNYLPSLNMEKGIIKEDWPDDFIFKGDKS